jgi:hypothetical protein
MKASRCGAPGVAWLLSVALLSSPSHAATGSLGAEALAACVRHHGGSTLAGPTPAGQFHPKPSIGVAVFTRGDFYANLANVYFYSSPSLAHAGEQHYVADMVNLSCSRASATLRHTCILNIEAETQPLVRYTIGNVFVQFHSEHPSTELRATLALCLRS